MFDNSASCATILISAICSLPALLFHLFPLQLLALSTQCSLMHDSTATLCSALQIEHVPLKAALHSDAVNAGGLAINHSMYISRELLSLHQYLKANLL